MPSYEQIQLIGGPCDGEVHMWDGGDYFQVAERPPALITARLTEPVEIQFKRHTYRRYRDEHGRATTRFVYQGEG